MNRAPADWENRRIVAAQVCLLAYASGFQEGGVGCSLPASICRAPERAFVCIFTSACAAHTVESDGSGYAKAS
jgi:hypothetical protein